MLESLFIAFSGLLEGVNNFLLLYRIGERIAVIERMRAIQ